MKRTAAAEWRTAIEKGYKCDYAIVGEPSDLDVVPAHNGLLWLYLTSRGVAAHGSAPWAGVNAIERMMEVVEELRNAVSVFPPNDLTGPMSLNLGIIKAGDLPNRVPERCEAVVDIRLTPPTRLEQVREAVRPVLESRDWLTCESGKDREALSTPLDSPLVKAVLACAKELGVTSKIVGGRGWTEAESFRSGLGIDALVCGPGRHGAGAHVQRVREDLRGAQGGGALREGRGAAARAVGYALVYSVLRDRTPPVLSRPEA